MVVPTHEQWVELLSASVDGQIDPDEQIRLDEHLAECASCTTLQASFAYQRRKALLQPPAPHDDLVAGVLDARGDQLATSREMRRQLSGRALVAGLVVLAGILGALAFGRPQPTPEPERVANQVLIDAENEAFARTDVEVVAGTTVRWRNAGTTTHRLVRRLGNATVIEELSPGQTETTTFAEPGTYEYFCTVHEGMSGTITVDA